ncbi:helix-turn-helix transcriptional regulator [Nocardioides terrisoli]|uniref:helix-turn-helix transcriptional regulator n=1 Tax=Nocardioides terrisoli TaxID=3388267 RepID=UPI00287BC677|nr:WYL domain-containing protein [Nocardioides marmorisolisilvae]
MTATKSERLVNLVILLLVSKNYVSKERIRESIPEYREATSTDAFEKKFERDKDELRALGIPIEVGHLDKFFDDDQGYRIARDAFELPEIDFEPDEVAVLGLAARVWQHAGLAATTSDALVKLKSAGLDVDRRAIDAVHPTLAADDPAFEPLWQATLGRTPVEFDYRRPGDLESTHRHLQPWGVITADERWYVVGMDTDRGEPRMFRLGRIVGPVQVAGPPGSFEVPPGTDLRELSHSLAPRTDADEAVVLIRSGQAHGLRRWAEDVQHDVRPGWDRARLRHRDGGSLAAALLRFGDAVLVESPEDLRETVRTRLARLVEAGR